MAKAPKRRSRPTPARKPRVDSAEARAARERRVAERAAVVSRAASRRRRKKGLRVVAAVGVAVLVVGFFAVRVVQKRRDISRIVDSTTDEARSAGCGGIRTPRSAGRTHIANDRTGSGYTSNPPTSGSHFTNTAGTGVSAAEVPNERLIHNLEHGGVVIHHNRLADDQLAALTEKVRDLDDAKLLLVPNSALPATTNVALTAWGRLQTCERYDADVLDGFLRLYMAPDGRDVAAPEKDQPL